MASEGVALIALLFAMGGVALAVRRQRADADADVDARFTAALGVASPAVQKAARPQAGVRPRVRRLLLRAGIENATRAAGVFVAAAATLSLFGLLLSGPLGALGMVALAIAAGGAFVHGRVKRRQALILEQLPFVLGHMMRAVSAGSSLQQALLAATAECHKPIREVFDRVERQVGLGMALEDAFEQAASAWGVTELDTLSFTLRASIQYGGSVRDSLAAIVTAIRQREQARREFRALTGETRLSAWILGALPPLVALHVSVVNPHYLASLWEDPDGRSILWAALALEAAGAATLWRMVRSV